MIKLKPTNIFDYYAPTGDSMKIADFGITKKTTPTAAAVASNSTVPDLPNSDKKDNTWLYILAGAVIIIGGICYVNYKMQKDEEEMQSRLKRNVNRNT